MKLSKAILKGYEANGGRQCVNQLEWHGAMCVMGARNLAVNGDPFQWDGWADHAGAFKDAWGVDLVALNNNDAEGGKEPFPWEHIYGMAVAAGL